MSTRVPTVSHLEAWHRRVITGQSTTFASRLARGALHLASIPYAAAVGWRNRGFDRRPATKLPRPTVSIGNVTAGGTGKTPTVAWLASVLMHHDERPAVLTRGYGSRPGETADEEQLLAELLGDDVPIHVNPDRVAGAAAVVAERPDVSVFLLDDGFQHRRAGREFNLVLVDTTCPDGFGHVLPRGYLREPFASIARADAVLLTRCNRGDADAAEALVRRHFDGPIYRSHFRMTLDASGPVVVASGIGNPHAFAADVRAIGIDITDELRFPDHHPFSVADVARITVSVPTGGSAVVTGKDWTKLRPLWPADVPIAVAGQELVVDDAAGLIDSVLAAIRPAAKNSTSPAVKTKIETHIE